MSTIHSHPDLEVAEVAVQDEVVTSSAARRALAVLRIGFGLTFLWAFFDKLLALGYATGTNPETGAVDRFGDAAWINGASPTEGFLTYGVNPDSPVSPGSSTIWPATRSSTGCSCSARSASACPHARDRDALRRASQAGVLYLMMYAAVMVPENNPSSTTTSLGAITVVVLALTLAGDTWGWARCGPGMPFVRGNALLR
jgi:thiosulfate dehydrogenase [quinone] large subunit